MSGIRMRQICLVARSLAPVVDELRAGLGLEVCHRDPGVGKYGLENALFPVGDGFLEVVAPVREGTTAGRYLERRGGDGGYMVILQCDDHPLCMRRRASGSLATCMSMICGTWWECVCDRWGCRKVASPMSCGTPSES